VFPSTPSEVSRDADVKGAVSLAGKNANGGFLIHGLVRAGMPGDYRSG
jgi:hypothetical protein